MKVNRNGFPKSGSYRDFLNFYLSLERSQRGGVFIAPIEGSPGLFNFCCFPTPTELPTNCQELVKLALRVADLVDLDTTQN
jgi:hypothetical protein